jgi:hypothetical protein
MPDARSSTDLDVWLTPLWEALGRKTRRTWAPLYCRSAWEKALAQSWCNLVRI